MPPKATPGPNQEALFDIPSLEVAQLPPAPEPEPQYASVDVRQRAFELGQTLKALNAANARAGLQMAATTPHRQNLEQRYGAHTETVVQGARNKEETLLADAKQHFARAAGMYSLIGAGMPREDAARLTARMFDAFTARYGVGVTNAQVRNKTAKRIQDSADIIVGAAPKKRAQ